MTGHKFDAVVIGAGVIGAATAFELAKRGYRTLTVDSNGEAGHGSTGASCAVIRVHYSTREGTALAWEAYHHWRHWEDYLGTSDERGLATFLEMGCLVMKTEANGQMARHTAIASDLGIPWEDWEADRVRARLPHYRLDRFAPAKRPEDPGFAEPTAGRLEGAIWFPTAGYVTDPALAAHNLQRAAEAHGARFRFNARVVEILSCNGRAAGIRLASGEEIGAPVVVNVAGPASDAINRMAGVTGDMTIRTRALKQEVVHVPMPDGYFGEGGPTLVSDSDTYLYCRPERGSHLLIGSEDPPCDAHVWVYEPEAEDWRGHTEQSRIQAMRMAQRAPSIGVPNRPQGVVDLYDVSDDWIPIYDRSSLPGFYMACGTSGNQFKNAPVAGRMMAAIIEHEAQGGDQDTDPVVLSLPYTHGELPTRFFSRRREINRDSSFSVLG